MDEKIAGVGKDVLVDLVKAAQKKGMKGSMGNWKEFLCVYDKKFGSSLSDPTRRPTAVLAAFLKTFSGEDDLMFFGKLLQNHKAAEQMKAYHKAAEQLKVKPDEVESPEQRLVHLTLGHPRYPSDYSFPSHEEGWLVIKLKKKNKTMRSTEMIAIDCEMVLCEDGTEALVRVCVVDHKLQVKLNELVNPNKAVADYRSEITGITANDLDGVTCSLADIQKSMKKLLSHGTILVGHSLNNDLTALKINHSRVIDTSYIFKYGSETNFKRPSLNNLCKAVLGYEVREKGAAHNCLDDASAAMKVVLAKIESGFDEVIPQIRENVPAIEMSKLLLHRIPINIPSEEIHKIIPGDFAIEVKPSKKAQVEKYTALATFKSQQEANQAFENINGIREKDTSGLPQKCILFQLDSGLSGSLYVRKMVHDDFIDQVLSRKRSIQGEKTIGESKKLKSDQDDAEQTITGSNICDGHLKEIERLNQELKQRDQEISNLNRIIVALTRKQGL